MTFHKIIQPTIGPMYRVPTNPPQLYELAVGADLSCPPPIYRPRSPNEQVKKHNCARLDR